MKIDVIGDIHGCYDELCSLFEMLGYRYEANMKTYIHPDNRIPIFLGDLTDRGPHSLLVIELVYHMTIKQKVAKYVPGNHCNKLYRYFIGRNVKQQHGLETTVAELKALPKKEQEKIAQKFIHLYEHAPLYLQLPELQVIIAHAGIKESLIGRHDKKAETFVLYGDITGEFDISGRPVRRDWAKHYQGEDWIIYGHTPVLKPRTINHTINIDTGCVFGNALTAFRFPEKQTVSVPSQQPFQENHFRSFTDSE
ncbi:bis(5'-nucleosyl)-tetraphosphatase PrpE [Virgibacillus soli]|uniref:Bis(5'-nucleosyl)-tetraphosphatase PrpE n=1 Tax=Paracerasibacillus soli TaxID=480284 RepID=A0ABU5CNI0_9BACI|nr:bis(5'-nucleosyl)-tetraphosphatase PrpE [Virgibacillus soli]MDY0407917.1 bis(5'-nucleosyl)-tetraphosphatase PrpE [Virgibacillus soli]